MNDNVYADSVGVFDSGVGGISILRELVVELPKESFVFYGDSAHNPYGEKTADEVFELSRDIVERLLALGCKAIVIACNTATSVAADRLRSEFSHVPIIGVEPAVKPAALATKNGRVLVMATPLTVRLEKLQNLMHEWEGEAQVIPVACEGLAERIERGRLQDDDVRQLVEDLIGSYAGTVDSVVLGCTHYPFVAKQIKAVLGDVALFDGGRGTARQLRRRLAANNLLSYGRERGCVHFFSSSEKEGEIKLYQSFLTMPL